MKNLLKYIKVVIILLQCVSVLIFLLSLGIIIALYLYEVTDSRLLFIIMFVVSIFVASAAAEICTDYFTDLALEALNESS